MYYTAESMVTECTTSRAPNTGKDIAYRRHPALVLLIALATALGGCSAPLRRPSVPVADGVTNEQRIAAMLSIHAHARWPDDNFDGAQFLPLRKAVDILKRDRGMAAASRRRRAIAKLAAYSPGNDDTHRAIADLLMNRQDLMATVYKRRTDSAISPALLEVAIVNELTALTPDCPWSVPAPPSGGVQNPPPVAWSYDVSIPRNMEDVARALDPQSWDQCSPFFEDTHLASTASPCCPTTSSCAETGVLSKPAGKPYNQAVLHERFCIADDCGSPCPGPNSCNVDFETLLCVTTEYDAWVPFSCMLARADRYKVDYHLASWISGELFGAEKVAVITDQGSLSTRRAAAAETATLGGSPWSVVHVDKTLDFANSGQTGAVGKFLQALQDELAGQIVEQACCEVPKEGWCAVW
jgi:hypothetical protein